MDDLILLPEEEAVRAFLNDLDRVALGRLLVVMTICSLIGAVAASVNGLFGLAGAAVAALVAARVLIATSDRSFFEQHFRIILLVYLAVHLLGLRLWTALQFGAIYGPLDFLLPLVPTSFYLRRSHTALLLVPLWGLSAGRDVFLAAFKDHSADYAALTGVTALGLVVFFWIGRKTSRRRQDFLLVWRREHQRYRERNRMQVELDEARRIQLSMLPRSDPSNPFFEIAGISIPASEVGGDYYEYFSSDDDRQTVVVADVAGHGVASGLLLAGVRSCLYLLKDDPLEPADVLQKLDPVVRETTGRREFVTMLYTHFDPRRSEVVLASAGHPPMLHYSAAERTVHEIEVASLPLGTRLRRPFEARSLTFAKDDIFLLYTDGIAETLNPAGDLYGNERLSTRLKTIARDRSAKEIRDTLLGDVWSFKADGEQTDDITLVVVKIS